jgi:hypothetical protein
VLLRNLSIILYVIVVASRRIPAIVGRVLRNPQFDPNGHFVARANMTLGLLYKARKNDALAIQHLTEAKRMLSPFGQTSILGRVEAALAELGQ